MNIVCVDDGQRWIHYARLGLGFSYGLTSYYSDVNDIPMGINDKLNAVIDRLAAVGGGEDKFLRQIPVCYIIQAPLYWWSEMDTYKIGTQRRVRALCTVSAACLCSLSPCLSGLSRPICWTN